MGEKYGSIRVPGEVDSAEFEMILDAAVEAGMDTHILEEWYCRDENSVPPAYYLKPKAQMLKNHQNSVSPPGFLKSATKSSHFSLRSINILRSSFRCPLFELSSFYSPTTSGGVEQRSQDKEWQGLEESLRGDQEDLQSSGAAAAGEGNHDEHPGQEIPLLWSVSGQPLPPSLSLPSFHVCTLGVEAVVVSDVWLTVILKVVKQKQKTKISLYKRNYKRKNSDCWEPWENKWHLGGK